MSRSNKIKKNNKAIRDANDEYAETVKKIKKSIKTKHINIRNATQEQLEELMKRNGLI